MKRRKRVKPRWTALRVIERHQRNWQKEAAQRIDMTPTWRANRFINRKVASRAKV